VSNSIQIFNNTSQKFLPLKKIQAIAAKILEDYHIKDSEISIIFLTDTEIQKINSQYLNHNYATDVISFNFEEENLEGEIYISVDTARIQAQEYKVSLTNEVLRLSIHGIMHLLGYEDDSVDNKEKMHNLEEKYLKIIFGK
jgi:rRNA maturation RNase YbeY